jgi:hypothetical protein
MASRTVGSKSATELSHHATLFSAILSRKNNPSARGGQNLLWNGRCGAIG